MSTFISGGCKNGKSFYAQRIAKAAGTPLYYIATMIPRDREDDARIVRHRQERAGWGFETLECGADILSCLDRADPAGAFLLDSVTALLSNEMFTDTGMNPGAPEKIARELTEFVRRAPKTVLVSDYIYSDANLYDDWTEAYRRGLARIDRALAAACDDVLEVVHGQVIVHKGALPCV
ncbi:MAG: bifunctional adenosylcobinamide kinase/adenosylcobinamide-phosphate guanylyltransferase [Clostridia bacterium]|nr:bifunctional adenosylcobinamide kinase/adenosylcobinamide-phosphate guanylyltransferase [Clostridia bacterium]